MHLPAAPSPALECESDPTADSETKMIYCSRIFPSQVTSKVSPLDAGTSDSHPPTQQPASQETVYMEVMDAPEAASRSCLSVQM